MASNPFPGRAWLGLDLGTQSVRAMVVHDTGETLAIGSHKLTSRRDGPRHEQDPEEWWNALSAACRAALAALPAGLTIHGVAVDGTSGTILLIDGNGRPLTPALPQNAEAAFGMAVLAAASAGRKLADMARAMVRIREIIDPRPDHAGRFCEPYLRLVDELALRGWVTPAVAQHAHQRAAA